MVDKVTPGRFLRLLGISAKMDLAWLLRDSKYAIVMIITDIIQNVGMIAGMFLIAARFGGIGGMNTDEVLFMMAYSSMTTGIIMVFGANNNIAVSRIIGRGQMEHKFLQPLPLTVQMFTCSFLPFTGAGSFITGVVLMVISLGRLHLHITFLWLLSLLAYQIATLTLIVARSYLVSSLTFYSPTTEDLSMTIMMDTWFLSSFPLSGMPKFIQFPLLTIMPEGLMAWFPALCLLGKPPLGLTAYYPMLFALLITLIATYFFRKGMNYYVRKGSNRYVPWGFRR
jgi:ABC-2 type transport system permease protein